MKTRKTVIVIAALLLCVFMIAGCSSGSSSDGSSESKGKDSSAYGPEETFELADAEFTLKKIEKGDSGSLICFRVNGVGQDNMGDFTMTLGEGDSVVVCDNLEMKFEVTEEDGGGLLLLCFGFSDIEPDSVPDTGHVIHGTPDSDESVQVDLSSLDLE